MALSLAAVLARAAKAIGAAPRRVAVALALVAFLVYLSNLRFIFTSDTNAVRYVPLSILLDGRLDVDRWIAPELRTYRQANSAVYFASRSRGHWMSSYPILTPILATPFYAPTAIWVSEKGAMNDELSMQFYAKATEKLCAALIASLSVGVLFLALRRAAGPGAAFLIALIYAFASPTWSTSGQALWLHGVTELSLALLLWALLSDDGGAASARWIGLAAALSMANKPTNAVAMLPIVCYSAWRGRARIVHLLLPIAMLGGLVAAYNVYFFGNPLGAYPTAFRTIGYGNMRGAFAGNLFSGVAGLLVSPSRGALWYFPWIAFAVWGGWRLWKEQRWPWSRVLVLSGVALFLTYAKLERWYGGHCFGPRHLTDIMPLLALCLAALWPVVTSQVAVRAALSVAVLIAFGVQLLGAYFYPGGAWDSAPVSVDDQPQRLWDWRDPQLARVLRGGLPPTRFSQHVRGDHRVQ